VIEELTNIPVVMELASDFQDRSPPIFRDDVCCFISQSGETKDTLNALEYCAKNGAFCVGFTNTVGSTIARITHCGVHINAGAEIGVASTKAYTSQIVALLMFGLMLCANRACAMKRRKAIVRAMGTLSQKVQEALSLDSQVKAIAEEMKDSRSLLLMGRGYQYASVLEGALKIKELSYIHSEGIHTGELNFGPLALVSADVPVIMLCTSDLADVDTPGPFPSFEQIKGCLQQVLKRQGKPIVIVDHLDDPSITSLAYKTICVPQTINCLQPILNIIPLQLLSYHLAVLRGQNVDCPRNLAKSVTV
jgi:glucosamine--fructose-6-phosphate aminotransferase (isomerizing)